MKKLEERAVRIGKKGVTVIPKRLREAAGISEGSEVKVQALPFGILLRPVIRNPVETLENLPTERGEKAAVETVRRLRKKIDTQVRKNKR